MGEASSTTAYDDMLLKSFFAEVSEVERDNEVTRILSCFKLNPFEYLNLPFEASPEDVKKQYRKLSLLVHPDKCKHPQAKEAFGALAKAQQLLLEEQERDYVLTQVNAAKEELRAKRKKQLKKDTASKIKSLVDECGICVAGIHLSADSHLTILSSFSPGKYDQQYEQSEEFQRELKLKVREILTDQEWRRRKMQMRVSSWRDFMKTGKKGKKGEIRPPKLKTEDPNKSYVQRPVKRG
ncbi:hypothetical protein POTOM_005226 [Populus tomentosa]|uniref:J domain-containing protein n=1 Tax=Populus tomentosa TaxID=118781 RepID=A0A8X8AIY2_POPTO|nr:hypothetical protein POTOM_005226 [Populus tomentosa]